MKSIKLICGFMFLAGLAVSGSALADREHGGGHGGGHAHLGLGFYFGAPYPYSYPYPYYPSPYYYPYTYYPPVVVAPSQPPVYVEQQGDQSAPQQVAPASTEPYYWYHCDKPEGYYPYVKECPNGWQKVSPTPPPQQ